MQGQQSHHEPYYRCRFPEEYALANRIQHPRNVFLREADVIGPLDSWLVRAFAPHRLETTLTALAEAARNDTEDNGAETERIQQQLRECDTKLARYQAALDAGGDPATIVGWTNQVTAEKTKAQARLRAIPRKAASSKQDIKTLITGLGDIIAAIHGATPQEKAAVYRSLGIQGTYHPGKHQVRTEANLYPDLVTASASPRGVMVRVRGGT
ncbi:hypothetical protein [Streptomyces sp. NPDC059743]|uniref:hypothetical protein n=1 Tax=Streptomyces sp. NPDC059743 TaxID=3346928 RepID=UPI00364D4D84